MKIGIDARFVGPEGTGIGKYTEKLIENLQKIDSKNTYSIFLKESNWNLLKLTSKNFQKVLADVSWYSFQEQVKMPNIYSKEKLDLLHVPHFNVPILYNGKFVVTIHDLIHLDFAQTSTTTKNIFTFHAKRLGYKKVLKNALNKSQKIITPSNFVKNEIIKRFNMKASKIIVTYEAAGEEYFDRQPSTVNRQQSLLYVGNAYPHKNLNNLLDAFKILITHHSRQRRGSPKAASLITKLVLVCPRDVFSNKLKREIEKRNLQKAVEVKGYMQPNKLSNLFKRVSAYICPSLSEGFGIPGLNAMAAGLPVICSNIPTFKEIYGKAVCYFNPEDPEDIAKKIQTVMKELRTRLDLVLQGGEQAKRYSWQKMAKETLEIYESV